MPARVLASPRDYSQFKILFLLCITAAQLADVISTDLALRVPGAFEANPLMLASQATFGSFWWLPKLALLLPIALTLRLIDRLDRRCALAFVGSTGIYLMVVLGNLWIALRAV